MIQREYFGKAIAQLMLKVCKAANVFAREAANIARLTIVLSVVDSNLITLETSTASLPGGIRSVGDDAFTHVIMPMHIGGR